MTKEFSSIGQFVAHLSGLAVEQHAVQHRALEKAAVLVEGHAKAKFGEYQPEGGGFVAWAELADSTKQDRVAQGFTENDPLLRSGATRDSISHKVSSDEAQIGSNSDILVYQELGTAHIPPRSVLGATGAETADAVVRILGHALTVALVGHEVHMGAIKIK